MENLRFQAWNSAPDVSFWQRLTSLKLNEFQLSDKPQELRGYFAPGRSSSVPARFTVDDTSFNIDSTESITNDRARYEWQAPGILYNTNTLEDFRHLDKASIISDVAKNLWEFIENPSTLSPQVLNSFIIIAFADLKKHSFIYWFGFPALSPPNPITYSLQPVDALLSSSQQTQALTSLLDLKQSHGLANIPPFFVLQIKTKESTVTALDLASWSNSCPGKKDTQETIFAFVDPCALPEHPGWPLRNYLAFISQHSQQQEVQVISFREHLHHLTCVPEDFAWKSSLTFKITLPVFNRSDCKVVGWEANARGKMGPRSMELASFLDSSKLAESSVDLNLRLMRWRELPNLDLDRIASTKCLVLGAGTLGCYTARSLLAWGFRHFTLVDNSTVSHSNPVRQPLFEFADVGKSKAECAANALKRIFPMVQAESVEMNIPMAGHALSNEALMQEARTNLQKLEELIRQHDIVFVGTDSRESRWLPTVICAVENKLLMNAALGFDSYLVMRHGVAVSESKERELGCYFCNDIVSPRDSLKDRTLDQMCTVTRPGLAPIASAMAVELAVAVLHAEEGAQTNASLDASGAGRLEFIPHQMRGFLNEFRNVVVKGERFDKCIACGTNVLEKYEENAMELLVQACNVNGYLEELTGLSKLTEQADDINVDFDDSDEETLL